MALPLSVKQNMHKTVSDLKGLALILVMAPGRPKSLKDLLAGSSLSRIVEQAAETDVLTRRVQALLPPEVSPHVLGANLRERRLVVLVDAAVWAARVRFETAALRRGLSESHEVAPDAISVKVRPAN
jgi:hypothetical protein